MSNVFLKTLSRNLALTLVLVTLVNSSCNEVVGPVPEFVFEFDDFNDLALDEVDTASIVAEEVTIAEGAVSNAAAESFQTTTAATATAVATAVTASVSPAQTTYWSGQSQADVVANLEAGNTDILNQVSSITSTFSGNGTLSDYLTSLTSPTGGRSSARAVNSNPTGSNASSQPLARTTADLDDCRAAAQQAYDDAITELDLARTASLSSIENTYTLQLAIITSSASEARLSVNERHANRLASFLLFYNTIASRITTLTNEGSISAAQASTLNLFNLIVYAININSSRTLRDSELTLVSSLEVTNTGNLSELRRVSTKKTEDSYGANVSSANRKLELAQGNCHNQGGTTGG